MGFKFIILIFCVFFDSDVWCWWGCSSIKHWYQVLKLLLLVPKTGTNSLYLSRLSPSWSLFCGIVFGLTWDRSGMSPRSIPTCCNRRGGRFVYSLMWWQTEAPQINNWSGGSRGCTTYLRNFEELGDSCHSCEEFLVDIKSLFALDFLHVKIFFYRAQSAKLQWWFSLLYSEFYFKG